MHRTLQTRRITIPSTLTCHISLPQPYQPVDGELDLDFALTTCSSGPLKLHPIRVELFQTIQLIVFKDGTPFRTTKKTAVITSTTMRPEDIISTSAKIGTQDEGVGESDRRMCFSVPLPLPLPPYACAQSIDEEGINVRYKLRVTLSVDNEHGETCEVGASAISHRGFAADIRGSGTGLLLPKIVCSSEGAGSTLVAPASCKYQCRSAYLKRTRNVGTT